MARFHSSSSSQTSTAGELDERWSLGHPAPWTWGQWDGLETRQLEDRPGDLDAVQGRRHGRALWDTPSSSPAREVAVAAGHLAFSLAGRVTPLVLLIHAS